MPIKIPNDLPARQFLEDEGLVVMRESDATLQDIRPIRIALLNLMPQKEKTEIQLARLIGSTPLQVEMTLVTTSSYTPIHTSRQHMLDFYRPWEDIKDERFDGLGGVVSLGDDLHARSLRRRERDDCRRPGLPAAD